MNRNDESDTFQETTDEALLLLGLWAGLSLTAVGKKLNIDRDEASS